MDIYLDRTLELGQKLPYGAPNFQLELGDFTYFMGNPGRVGASFPVKLKAALYCADTNVLNLVAEVQPQTKAADLGYIFKYETAIASGAPDRILACMGSAPEAPPVGVLSYLSQGAYLVDEDLQVAPEHRRRGIATAMFQQAEAITGRAFLTRVGEPLPIDAAAFWGNPDRPFGVDALYAQPRRLLWINLQDLMPAPLRDLPQVVFDGGKFANSSKGQACLAAANSAEGPMSVLQEARMRGLAPKGRDGRVEGFVPDPHAQPKFVRTLQCAMAPPRLSLCNTRGLPDPTVSPTLAALQEDSYDEVLAFIGRHLGALVELQMLEVLHDQCRAAQRGREGLWDPGDPAPVERALAHAQGQAMSVLTDVVERDTEWRHTQV
jgi:GNAT superfamily N-acetyltransferase